MTPNQRIFADEYIKTRNATQAYLKAYPKTKNSNIAGVKGHNLLRNGKVAEYIDKQLDAVHDDTIADAAEIMRFFTETMRGQNSSEMSDRTTAAKALARMLGVDSRVDAEKLKIEQARAKREAAMKASTGAIDAILEAVKRIE